MIRKYMLQRRERIIKKAENLFYDILYTDPFSPSLIPITLERKGYASCWVPFLPLKSGSSVTHNPNSGLSE